MKTLQPYGAYKDSGVEWLRNVPAHWAIKKLKELAHIKNSNVDKKIHEHETSVKLCNYVDVYKNEFIDNKKIQDILTKAFEYDLSGEIANIERKNGDTVRLIIS